MNFSDNFQFSLNANDMSLEQLNELQIEDSASTETTPAMQPQIVNVVATFSINNTKLNLSDISTKAKNAEYNPRRFSAVVMRKTNPRTTSLIFPKGKIVVTGAKTVAECKIASKKVAKIIKMLGYEVRYSNFNVQNIVATAKMGFDIYLGRLEMEQPELCKYEPEVFPGLIYRLPDLNMKALVFRSGSVVFVGAKDEMTINLAYRKMYTTLLAFKREEEGSFN